MLAREDADGGGRVRVVIGWKFMREPPVKRCRYTFGESPTDSRVLPSGEMEAAKRESVVNEIEEAIRRTMVNGNIQSKYSSLLYDPRRALSSDRYIVKLYRTVVIAHSHSRLDATLMTSGQIQTRQKH